MKIVYAVWGNRCDDAWLVALFETRAIADVCCDRLMQSERGKYVDYEVRLEGVYASLQEYCGVGVLPK